MDKKLEAMLTLANSMIGDLTPLKTNCGELCGGVCCKGDDAGMLMFPGEKEMLEDVKNFEMVRINYIGKKTWLLMCEEPCSRERRPLACRIFPLAPYICDDGTVAAVMDPRADNLCPLYTKNLPLQEEFTEAVENVFTMLAEDDEMYSFIERMSMEFDIMWEEDEN